MHRAQFVQHPNCLWRLESSETSRLKLRWECGGEARGFASACVPMGTDERPDGDERREQENNLDRIDEGVSGNGVRQRLAEGAAHGERRHEIIDDAAESDG